MNRRLTTISVVIAAVICAIIAGALIGGITQPRLHDVQGVSDESTPVATVAATASVIESPAPDATATPPVAAPIRESPTATAAPTRESSPTATVAPTPSASPAPASPAPAVITYTVQPGDILNRIAQQFNTTPQAIIELNPGINPDSLRIGDVLQIPAP